MSTVETNSAGSGSASGVGVGSGGAGGGGAGVWAAWLGMGVRSIWRAAWELYEDGRPLMAAALAFRTVFSLLPIFVIGFVLLRAVSGTDKIVEDTIKNVLELTGLSNVVVESGPSETGVGGADESSGHGWSHRDEGAAFEEGSGAGAGEGAAGGEEAAGAGGAGLNVDAEGEGGGAGEPVGGGSEPSAALQDWILDVVGKAQRIDFSAIGLVGVLMLAYAAMSLVVEMEQSFNRLCGVNRGRSWVRRFQHYWLLLTVGPPMLALSFAAQQWLLGMAAKLQTVTGATVGSVVVGLSGVLTPLALSWLLLLMLYSTIPTVRLRPAALALGSAAAAVLLEAGKYGFSQYLHMSSGYVTLYKSLALIPLFLLWVYVMWVIVLSGLKLSFVMHQEISTRELGPIGAPGPAFDEEESAAVGADEGKGAGGNRGGGGRVDRSGSGSISSAWEGDAKRLFEPSITLVVMARAAEAFARGRTLEVLSEGAVLGLGHTAMRRIMDALEDAGYLVRVVKENGGGGGIGGRGSEGGRSGGGDGGSGGGGGGRERFALAKPAGAVDLRGVLDVGYSLCQGELPGRAGAAMEALRRTSLGALNDRMLDSLVVPTRAKAGGVAAGGAGVAGSKTAGAAMGSGRSGVSGQSGENASESGGGRGVGESAAGSGGAESDTLRLRLKGTAEG